MQQNKAIVLNTPACIHGDDVFIGSRLILLSYIMKTFTYSIPTAYIVLSDDERETRGWEGGRKEGEGGVEEE